MRSCWILAALLAGCGREPGPALVVAAASSLREVAGEVAAEWTRRGGRPVELRVEASSTLARQVRGGAPADLFLSASPEWIDAVAPLERREWLRNRLVVVVRREVRDFDLARAASLALANEQVPAGKYAEAALRKLGIPVPARAIRGSNVRDVLSKVSRGGAEAGIVYATDAAVDPELRIAYEFPRDSHPDIVLGAALLAPRAKGLFDALREPWALEIARRHGFEEAR